MELADAEEEFSELILVQDNATKWNSAYLIINRALKKRDNVKRFIKNSIYEINKNKTIPVEDKLTTED